MIHELEYIASTGLKDIGRCCPRKCCGEICDGRRYYVGGDMVYKNVLDCLVFGNVV